MSEENTASKSVYRRFIPYSNYLKSTRIVTIVGLPGVGKTTVASTLAEHLGAVHLNADFVRSTINKHLGFTNEDRIQQSVSMATMARLVADAGHFVVVDLVCPTKETRTAYQEALTPEHAKNALWVELTRHSHDNLYEDTKAVYEPLSDWSSYHVKGYAISLVNYTVPKAVDRIVNCMESLKEAVRK